jgi:hypothetical protein
MYKQLIFALTGQVNTFVILKTDTQSFIPCVASNSDYLEYLDWMALGNIPMKPDGNTENWIWDGQNWTAPIVQTTETQ